MSDLQDVISRLERVIQTGATDKDGKHPISAEFVLEELKSIADRPQGEWKDAEIPLECGGAMPIQACSLCKTFYPLAYTGGGHRFCPCCGARMKGADDE